MRLTTKGRYAVTALLDLATQGNDAVVSLSDISERQAISVSYLEQLFSKLRKKGLVVSIRGASGGYKIAQPTENISVLAIIDAVDENVNATRCAGKANCQGGEQCLTHDLWTGLTAHIADYLSDISLSALLGSKSSECQPVAVQQSTSSKVKTAKAKIAKTNSHLARKHISSDNSNENSHIGKQPYGKQTPEQAATVGLSCV